MKLTNLVTAGALFFSMNMATVYAQTEKQITDSQKEQLKQLIHEYLVNNPEVLVEASQVLQKRQQDAMQKDAKSAIAKNSERLAMGDLTVSGNVNGNVTLVEFFDYQCIHCKKMGPVIESLIKKNKELRVVYKEFPIFGKDSETASKIAISAALQNKYDGLQKSLFNVKGRLNEAKIMEIAKDSGLDMEKLKTDMNSPKVAGILKDNRELAEKIRLMGTPAFVILSTPNGKYNPSSVDAAFIPGAASEDTLQELINKAK